MSKANTSKANKSEDNRSKSKIKILVACILALVLILSAGLVTWSVLNKNHTVVFYVATNGDDGNSGRKNSPLRTLAAANAKIEDGAKYEIIFRGGEYSFAETADMQGVNNVVYTSYGDESVVFSGGETYTGFERIGADMYRIDIGTGHSFRQIYVDGTKGIRAREPNVGEYKMITQERVDVVNTMLSHVAYYPIDTSGIADFKEYQTEVVFLTAWSNKRFRIKSIEPGKAFIGTPEIEPIQGMQSDIVGLTDGGHRYWLENSRGFIDAANEWFYDTDDGFLYYKSEGGQVPGSVVIPVTDKLINMDYCSNITISGITFAYTNWDRPNKYGHVDTAQNMLYTKDYAATVTDYDDEFRGQYRDFVTGAVEFSYTDNIVISDCVFTNLGGIGIRAVVGGSGITLQGNEFYNIAASAIQIGENIWNADNTAKYHKNILIDNNYIDNISTEYASGPGICVFFFDGLVISHNTLTNLPYIGISVGLGATENLAIDEANGYRIQRNCRIEYNYIENVMSTLHDGGLIYVSNPFGGENYIRGNYIVGNFVTRKEDIASGVQVARARGIGIYHDGCNGGTATNFIDENNYIKDSEQPFYFQKLEEHGQVAKNITVRNNYLDAVSMNTVLPTIRWLTGFDARNIRIEGLFFILVYQNRIQRGDLYAGIDPKHYWADADGTVYINPDVHWETEESRLAILATGNTIIAAAGAKKG
ncbi:MAG: right-handed parallel beta-helix repeat-containing protein [Clostridiales bacterium]|jgi:hypothetical protein|nr:right-handed parallel beta-helix repeat-containing protein [Clostridiales bacterium]